MTKTITTIEELETVIDSTDKLFVRWSHGPEADAANGWISKNWAGTWQEWRGDYDYVPVDEAGLSATEMTDPRDAKKWAKETYGTVCYVLTGRVIDRCSDDEPLLVNVEPIAIISADLIAAI